MARAVWFSPIIIFGLVELALFLVSQLQRGPNGKHGSLLSEREIFLVWILMAILGILCFAYFAWLVRSMFKRSATVQTDNSGSLIRE